MLSFMCPNFFVDFLLEGGFFSHWQNTSSVIVPANNPAKHTNYINAVLADAQCSILQVPNQIKQNKTSK